MTHGETIKLVYQLANYEGSSELATAFKLDKRKLRSGEVKGLSGSASIVELNRPIKSAETAMYYGFVPGIIQGPLPIMMGTLMLLLSAFMLAIGKRDAIGLLLGAHCLLIPVVAFDYVVTLDAIQVAAVIGNLG